VPDRVPVEQRGEAAGYVGSMTILGNVVGLGLAALLLGKISTSTLANTALIRSNAGIYYIVTAILLMIGLVVTIFFVREKPLMKRTRELVIQKELLLVRAAVRFVHDWVTPWRSYNFTVVFLARASLMLGLSLFMTYIEYYFARVQHVSNFVAAAGIIAILALGGAVVSGVLSGILADRIRRRVPVVCMATLFMGAASLAFVLFPDNLMNWLWPLGVVFGLGYGAYSSVDWALSIDVLPSLDQAGKDMGVWNASATMPAIAAPLVGSLIINMAAGFGQTALGYRLVFGAAAFFLILAAFGILFVHEGQKKQDTLTSRAA
jgi:MFS family permease